MRRAKTTPWCLGDNPLADPEHLDDLAVYPDENVREWARLAAGCDAFVPGLPQFLFGCSQERARLAGQRPIRVRTYAVEQAQSREKSLSIAL